MTSMSTGLSAAAHIEMTQTYAAHNYHPLPVVLASGRGAWVRDIDGRDYLDALAGYSALNFGHGHPRLVGRARRQLETLTLTSRASTTTSSVRSPATWPRSSARRRSCR